MPEVHPGSAGGLLAALDPLLQQLKDLFIALGRQENPLKSGQHRRNSSRLLGGMGTSSIGVWPKSNCRSNCCRIVLFFLGMVVNDGTFYTKPPLFSGVVHHLCE